MGLLSRLFGRRQEEPLERPAPRELESMEPESAVEDVEPEPEREPLRQAEPEPLPRAEATAEPELEAEPEPEPGLPAELSLTLEEAVAALRAAGSDGVRVGFLSREYLRAGDEERPGARRRLVAVLTEQLRSRGLLAEDGRFDLRDDPTLAESRSRV
jgi:hypothetical protein